MIDDYRRTAVASTRRWARDTNHNQLGDAAKFAPIIADLGHAGTVPPRLARQLTTQLLEHGDRVVTTAPSPSTRLSMSSSALTRSPPPCANRGPGWSSGEESSPSFAIRPRNPLVRLELCTVGARARCPAARYLNSPTARAITRAMVISEMADWPSMAIFAHRDMGIVSVGLNAQALVNDT